MENIWSILKQRVYANNRSFNSVFALSSCGDDHWSQLHVKTFRNLAHSITKRCELRSENLAKKSPYKFYLNLGMTNSGSYSNTLHKETTLVVVIHTTTDF